MAITSTVVAETSRIRIIRQKRTGRHGGVVYRLKNLKTGFFTEWDTDELFDLTEALDDLCDSIEDAFYQTTKQNLYEETS